MAKPRFLLVVFPGQGHVNPSLQLAKRLILIGCEVTFVTTVLAHRRLITKNNNFVPPNDMSFSTFSDGHDDGFGPKPVDFHLYYSELRRSGSEAIHDLVRLANKEGRPYNCLVYTLTMTWAADVAAELGIPVALLWVQTATVFDLCYFYFHGYGDLVRDKMVKDRSSSLAFPGLSTLDLVVRDLPTFLDVSDPKTGSFVKIFQEQFDVIDQETQPRILVNTFDALEPEALRAVCRHNYKLNLIGVGPLINPIDLQNPDDRNHKISEWLSSKPKGSVIYVSFGSIAVLSRPQMEEIAKGLLDFGRSFLWVIRENDNKDKGGEKEEEEKMSFREELEKVGKIVPWCCQAEVLSNDALGCFVSHCGWNSTLESLVCGVPVVAFPQTTDQITNAKLIEDMWKSGVRVKANEEGIVGAQEIKRCLELVMGGGEEMRMNAKKWRDLAKQVSKEGGSSYKNLKAFVHDVIGEKLFLVEI